jgi:hypothetical protein
MLTVEIPGTYCSSRRNEAPCSTTNQLGISHQLLVLLHSLLAVIE